jgi:hypothetical protein
MIYPTLKHHIISKEHLNISPTSTIIQTNFNDYPNQLQRLSEITKFLNTIIFSISFFFFFFLSSSLALVGSPLTSEGWISSYKTFLLHPRPTVDQFPPQNNQIHDCIFIRDGIFYPLSIRGKGRKSLDEMPQFHLFNCLKQTEILFAF